jgi:predicted Zn finger-like uncharacterized protein
MKFVCDRCQTRYSIADEKVRQKILRIRCKTCGNVIVVQGERVAPSLAGPAAMPRSQAKPAAPPPPPLPTSSAPASASLGGGVEWYVSISGAQAGPFSRADAAKRILAAKAGQPVHVWKDGMSAWKPAREVSVIARELSTMRRPPPPPPPPPPLPATLAKSAGTQPLPDRAGSAPKAEPATRASTLSKAAEIRTPRPHSSTSGASATVASLASVPAPVAQPAPEFQEDPATKKAEHLPDFSAPLAVVVKEEKTPPSERPVPPVSLVLEVPPASELSPPIPSIAAVGAPGAISETIEATASASSSIQDSIASSLVALPPPLQPPADTSTARPVARSGPTPRHQGLKYVIAAAVIVSLVIALVVLTLRGDAAKQIDPANTVGPAEKVEQPAVEDPSAGEAEGPNAKAGRGEKSSPVTRSGARHGGVSAKATAHPVAPTPEQEAAQRRMAKAPVQSVGAPRPNPFAEGAKPVSQDQISAVVRNKNNQAALKTCYERALKMDNHLTSGRIDVTVSIGTSGVVQRVIIDAPSSFILIEPCIKAAVKRWVFPPNTEEYGTNFPLIMQGGM